MSLIHLKSLRNIHKMLGLLIHLNLIIELRILITIYYMNLQLQEVLDMLLKVKEI